jgi:Zn-dependent peptidase ImmA (M78 family)
LTDCNHLKIEQNISRLRYILSLYKMTEEELLSIISKDRKNPICKEEIFADQIDPANLKKIDKVFNKGLHYYLDPKSPDVSRDASIFFRKSDFESDLNISARKLVNQFEDFKISLSALAKLADLKIDRKLPKFSISHDPVIVADRIRLHLYPGFISSKKDFLTSLITKFAEFNILVFEFVEPPTKKEKANIDGVFLSPNVIVLKRQQDSFSREIFTIIHELGHYLIEEEEVEEVDVAMIANTNLSSVERWCNDFAYHFLIDKFDAEIEAINQADSSNDYQHDLIKSISDRTNLSRLAIFTRLLLKHKISYSNYQLVKDDLDKQFKQWKAEKKLALEKRKAEGKKGGGPAKPINSPLLVTTIQAAFTEGYISEYEASKSLNTTPVKLESIFR